MNLMLFCIFYIYLYFLTVVTDPVEDPQASYEPFSSNPNYIVLFYKTEKSLDRIQTDTFLLGDEFSHCNAYSYSGSKTSQFPFRIGTGYVGLKGSQFQLKRCLNRNDKWIFETSFRKCALFNSPVILRPIDDLKDEEIIVISCKVLQVEIIKEIFIEEYPKLQVIQLYSDHQRNITRIAPDIFLPHGKKIYCLTNFIQRTDFAWRKVSRNNQPDYSMGQFLVINLDVKSDLSGLQDQPNHYVCTMNYVVNQKTLQIKTYYKFYVQVEYTVSISDERGTLNRIEYDVNESVHCISKRKTNETYIRPFFWFKPKILVLLEDQTGSSQTKLQDPDETLVIASQYVSPPILASLTCIIQGFATNPYRIFNIPITLLTNSISHIEIESQNDISRFICYKGLDQIFVLVNSQNVLPLSRLILSSQLVNVETNTSVIVPNPDLPNTWYYGVCIDSSRNMQTPIVLELGKNALVYIENVFPNFKKPPKNQIKGFIFKCVTTKPGYTVEWLCPKCQVLQFQKTIYLSSNQTAQLLEITSDTDMEITYVCCAKLSIRNVMEKTLDLNIIGSLLLYVVKPTYFFTLGDPVICLGKKINSFDDVFIPLLSKLIYTDSVRIFYNSTEPGSDTSTRSLWTPKIPKHFTIDYKRFAWEFSACCLLDDRGSCTAMKGFEVLVNYTFKYNYDIPTETIYPGNILKCCILRRNSLEPNKDSWDGDSSYNCLPARILFYANKDRSATPSNPGVLLYEGTQIQVPEIFEGSDITRAASFVKCYTDEYDRKANDLIVSAIQLYIKSCSDSPPPLIMKPQGQTLFLVNDTISCMSELVECQSGLTYNFIIERGGEFIDEIMNKVQIRLIRKYMGKYIRVTCTSRSNSAIQASRDISVESLPYDMTITGVKKLMTINSVITCASKGFPVPNIVWTENEEQSFLLIEDSAIIIRNWDKNGQYEYTCTAFNKHGDISQTIKFHLFNINMRDSVGSVKFYVILYLELLLYHVALVVILLFVFKEYIFVSNFRFS